MRRIFLVSLAGLGALSAGGCEGCLGLDDYTIVPDAGAGGSISSTSTGMGGNIPIECNEAPTGLLLAALPSTATPAGGDGNCVPPTGAAAGIDVFAIEVEGGACLARGRIDHPAGATVQTPLRLRHELGFDTVVAGAYRGGGLTLPPLCSSGEAVVLAEEPGATASLFVAQLQVQGVSFCTDWARRGWTSDQGAAGALRISATEIGAFERVAVAGTLGGASVQFEDGNGATMTARGHAFFAQFSSGGALETVSALSGAPGVTDGAHGLAADQSSWFVTGAVRAESPGCHGCDGPGSVLNAAGVCPEGTGGAGGAGGAGGMGPDSGNAFLWKPGDSGSCAQLATFGSDQQGDGDAQVGMGLSVVQGSSACTAYWTGVAGLEAWRFEGGDASTALYDTGGATRDAFIARLDGSDALACGSGSGTAWNVRMAAQTPGAAVVGDRIQAARCGGGGATAAVLARESGGAVDLHRCRTGASCEAGTASLSLATGAEEQLVLLGLGGDGALEWQGALGPVALDAGGSQERAVADLALDNQDGIYAAFTTAGALALSGVDQVDCPELADGAAAGTWVVALRPLGSGGRASCAWARRLAP